MNTRTLLAALIGGTFSFLLGWVIFGILLEPYYSANMVRYEGLYRMGDDVRIHGIFMAQVAWAALLAFCFERMGDVRSFTGGVVGGLVIGFFVQCGIDLYYWSTMNLATSRFLAIDVLINTAYMGLMGGVVAAVLGWKRPAQ